MINSEKNIKYIAFYDISEYEHEKRSVALCAVNVINYFLEVIQCFANVQIISPSRSLKKSGFYRGRKNRISDKTVLIQPPSFGVRTKIGRVVVLCFTSLWLIFYLLSHTKKGETIIVYHSVAIIMPIRIIKKIKKVKLILEVRELYSDARENYEEFDRDMTKLRRKEMNFISIADEYIFPTEILNKLLNQGEKPYVIFPGVYKSAEKSQIQKWNDNKIHIVYAGTLRKSKGVFDAIDLAGKLPSKYCIHILGSASKDRICMVKAEIDRISKISQASVSYEGQLRGVEFDEFLQKCHIGLSPQSAKATFNESSFPSKILTYFSNGLEIVSVRIPAIEESPIGKYIHYYENTVDSMASAILSIDLNKKISNKEILQELDSDLRVNLKRLLC